MGRARRRLAEMGLLQQSLPPGTRLLDLGCGTGDSLLVLRRRYGANVELVGADFSEKAVLRAALRLGGRASVCRANAKSLPFRTGSFTHITAFGVLEHIIDAPAAITEIRRVAQPGGHIYITTSNLRSVLQIINAGRLYLGRYPYGFQRNWTVGELGVLLSPWASIEELRIVHADWDMPLVRTIDSALGQGGWGRYIYAHCVRYP
jgi:SAM-dependent methyltransferase